MNISKEKLDLELARFFMALMKALDKPQLLPYIRKQILDETENFYTKLTDEEVKNWMRSNQK